MTCFWTARALAALMDGRWHGQTPADADAILSGLSIDSRTIQPGQVFLALRGERFDGHDFVAAALDRGAAFAVVSEDRPTVALQKPILVVRDTLAALQRLAAAWRDELAKTRNIVIAVAGSNGKTTTRHLIHHVLTIGGLQGSQSPKSFNNHIGVPLTLLAARASDHFVVVEVGTNHPGEIAALGTIVRPDIAVITSIGAEHLEFFGDLTAVAREEASILSFVRTGGMALIPRHAEWPEDFEFPVPVGVELAQFLWQDPVAEAVALPGVHNLSNAAAAAAVARSLGLDDAVIRQALASAQALEGRSQVIPLDRGVTLINDCYNANPSSMFAAMAMLEEVAGPRRRVMVLGDMLELGQESARAHADVVRQAMLSGAGPLILVGERITVYHAGAQPWPGQDAMPAEVRLFRRLNEQAMSDIVDQLRPGDVVLLKASRGMKLERLIPAIEARFPRRPAGQ